MGRKNVAHDRAEEAGPNTRQQICAEAYAARCLVCKAFFVCSDTAGMIGFITLQQSAPSQMTLTQHRT
jgi:hypothetical protein